MKIKLQLAKTYDPTKHDPAEHLVSDKLDGVRGYWNGGKLFTRGGKLIAAPSEWLAHLPDGFALDGEIYAGPGSFDRVVGIVNSQNCGAREWQGVQYHAFDAPLVEADAYERHSRMVAVVESVGGKVKDTRKNPKQHGVLFALPQYRVRDNTGLERMLNQALQAGREGLMLRRIDESYRPGRNDGLLKYKRMLDAEAVVVDYQAGTGKHKGRIGALVCECETEDGDIVTFKVGTGLTDAVRSAPPEIGSVISFAYQEILKSGAPRFPVFLRQRPHADLPEQDDLF